MISSSKSVFTPCRISDIVQDTQSFFSVKFYGRFVCTDGSTPLLMIFEDGESKIHVDYSFIESISCEKGEWYRLLGEVRAGAPSSFPIVSLNLPPILIADYESGLYADLVDVRDEFIFNFESLLAYACKHK